MPPGSNKVLHKSLTKSNNNLTFENESVNICFDKAAVSCDFLVALCCDETAKRVLKET